MKKYDSIVVLGATAIGKTKLAVAIAGQINGEILSIDSRMVYKQMDLGTGKDLNEYVYQNKPVSCHLMNICEPHEKYHIYQFQQEACIFVIDKFNSALLETAVLIFFDLDVDRSQITDIIL
jgi:tRNA dimethylallyltransferase